MGKVVRLDTGKRFEVDTARAVSHPIQTFGKKGCIGHIVQYIQRIPGNTGVAIIRFAGIVRGNNVMALIGEL